MQAGRAVDERRQTRRHVGSGQMMDVVQEQDRASVAAHAVGNTLRQRLVRPLGSAVEPLADLGILTDAGVRERGNQSFKEDRRRSCRGIQCQPGRARAA